MPLISRRTLPPGGFQYIQSHTGWQPTPMLDFESTVDQIIRHRLANPRYKDQWSTDWAAVANELDDLTCKRLAGDPNYCIGEATAKKLGGLPVPRKLAGLASVAADVSQYVKNTAAGIGLYLEWFGSGGPVTKQLADNRAAVCLQCPRHSTQLSIGQRFNEIAAREIMQVMGILEDMDLHATREKELGVCDVCDCPMAAKVFSELRLVVKHIRPEAKANLWENCWITKESAGSTTPS